LGEAAGGTRSQRANPKVRVPPVPENLFRNPLETPGARGAPGPFHTNQFKIRQFKNRQLTNRRSRTLFTSPSIMNTENMFEPPELMSGRGIPVTGIRPTTIPTFTRT
jgi:hypothetical protein